MNDIEINQTIDPWEDGECDECDIVIEDGAFDGFEGKTINITENVGAGSQGDVQAGIEFIYHMREHLTDVSVATIYLLAVYAAVLWIKRKLG
jgi:hypothetical protein